MDNDGLTNVDDVLTKLMDPRRPNRYVSRSIQTIYLNHLLEADWQQICGSNLARQCLPEKLVGQELHIKTANSMLANELYMMQSLFLQKVNTFLAGRAVVKKLYFHTGSLNRRQSRRKATQAVAAKVFAYTTCPKCGAKMLQGETVCSICQRAERDEMRAKVAELLRIQPWLRNEDCLTYYKCDKILFTAVKDNLKNYYFEQVRLGFADKRQSMLAVMFLTEKQPQEITPALYSNVLEFLRRDQSVSAFGSRLHGKK